MAYTTLAEVQSEFKRLKLDSGTAVTTDDVQRFIEEEDAYINAKICNLYQAPVDEVVSPISFKVLKRVNIGLVVDRIKSIIKVNSNDSARSQPLNKLTAKVLSPKKDLYDIQNGTLKLPDALAQPTVGFEVGGGTEPNEFSREGDCW